MDPVTLNRTMESKLHPHLHSFRHPPGVHRRDDDQEHAVRDQHLHREPGPGRHPRHGVLRPALHHLGRHQHVDIWIAHVQDRHLHPGESYDLVCLRVDDRREL